MRLCREICQSPQQGGYVVSRFCCQIPCLKKMSFQKKIGHCRQIVLCLCVPVKISSVFMRFKHEFILNSIRVLEWIWQIFIFCIYMHHKKLVFIYKWLFQHDLIELFRDSRFKSFLCLLLQNANITAIFNKTFYNCISPTMLEVTYRMHVWFNNPLNEASDICNIFSTRNELSVQSVRLSTQNQAQTTYGKCIYIWW